MYGKSKKLNDINTNRFEISISRIAYIIPSIVVLALLSILIEILVKTGIVKDFILPAPSMVIYSLFTNFPEMLPHLTETFVVCLVGVAISIGIAIIIALLMDMVPLLRRIFYPLLVATQTIPIMVITPIIILLLGYGILPRLVVVVLVCFFPVCVSFFDGLASTDPDMIMLMHSMKASKYEIYKHVKVPFATSHLYSGIRIAATYCVMATVIAEWQGSNSGIGIYMLKVRRSYDYDKMFAAIVLIVVMSLLFFKAAQIAERRALKWRYK